MVDKKNYYFTGSEDLSHDYSEEEITNGSDVKEEELSNGSDVDIESEVQIDRELENAINIVNDTYAKCYDDLDDDMDEKERVEQARFKTTCVSIIISGVFLDEVQIKRAQKDKEYKGGPTNKTQKTPSKGDRSGLPGLDGLPSSDESEPEY